METLIELMKKILADTFLMYVKAQGFHWNVEGINFVQLHDFFGKIYEELQESIDKIAEEIRTLNSYAPSSVSRFKELSNIEEVTTILNDKQMVAQLLIDNQKIIDTLTIIFKLCDKLDKQGLSDFISQRIDTHEKYGWMLRSIIK